MIVSCARLYTFENKRETDRKDRVWRQTTQSNKGLFCPLTESQDTLHYINGEPRPGWDLARSQDKVNPHILHMLEGTFTLGDAHIMQLTRKQSKPYLVYPWSSMLETDGNVL